MDVVIKFGLDQNWKI